MEENWMFSMQKGIERPLDRCGLEKILVHIMGAEVVEVVTMEEDDIAVDIQEVEAAHVAHQGGAEEVIHDQGHVRQDAHLTGAEPRQEAQWEGVLDHRNDLEHQKDLPHSNDQEADPEVALVHVHDHLHISVSMKENKILLPEW